MVMIRKKTIFVAVAVLAVLCGGTYLLVRGRGPGTDSVDVQKAGRHSGDRGISEREALLAELAKKRGGLPIDQALRQASTPEAKQFIEKDMAYQRQTRAEAADEARKKLAEVEARLSASTDQKERTALQNQVRMLEELISKLGGQ